ncbi:hypothetical protein EAE99_002949 [Botrytis elliptica]|nr:hypothetical protein EAE99_002949 [Botrytis elliptica]
MPCVNFFDEILAAFPNAKVVLTRREPVAWVKSFDGSIYRVLEWRVWPFLQSIDPEGTGAVHGAIRLAITDYTSPKPWTDREALAAHMSKHVELIRSVVPPEKLLEFHPRDGWEILCKFLGKEVPNEPFPYINKGNFTVNGFKLVLAPKTSEICGPYFMALGVAI